MNCAKRHVKHEANLSEIENQIDQTSSFHYQRNFRGLLISVLGIARIERLESEIDPRKFQLLQSSLGTLKSQRDSAAHNYIAGVTPNVFAPSSLMIHFQYVREGLEEIEAWLAQLRL